MTNRRPSLIGLFASSLLALLALADTVGAATRVASGSYLGLLVPQSITGLGFQPDFVIIKGDLNVFPVARSATMSGDASKVLGDNKALLAGMITSLNPDGFSVGMDTRVNLAGVTYYWTAFKGAPGEMVLGTYTGDGQDNRSITGPGFQPGYVIVMDAASEDAMQRFATQVGDASLLFQDGDEKTGRIKGFEPTGFQVGDHNTTNRSGDIYHYVAWRLVAGITASGAYTGNGSSSRTFSSPGFRPECVMVRIDDSGYPSAFRPYSLTGNRTLPMKDNASYANGIVSLLANGFTVGSFDAVNKLGKSYHWIAFQDSPSLDLSVSGLVNDSRPNEGDTLHFTVTVQNAGPVAASGIELTQAWPAGLTFLSAVPSQGSFNGGIGIWTLGALANSASATLLLSARVDSGTAGSTQSSTTSITALNQSDQNAANNSATVSITVQSADLALSKSVSLASPNEGDTLTYRIVLTNAGPDSATGVTVTDVLPAGVTFLTALTGTGSYNSGTGLWTVGTVAKADTAVLYLSAQVDSGLGSSTITNIAGITSADQADPNEFNNVSEADFGTLSSDLSLFHLVSDANPNEGDLVIWTLHATCLGPDSATAVEISAPIPAGLAHAWFTAGTGSFVPGTGAWSLPVLVPGQTDTLRIGTSVQAGTRGTTISRTASIAAATQADPVGTNNIASASIDVQAADLSLAKSVDISSPDEGDTLTFKVTVTNHGPDAATGLAVDDLLPAGLTFLSATTTIGAYAAGSGAWTIGTLPIGAATTLNLSARVDPGTAGSTITNLAGIAAVDQAEASPGDESDSASVAVKAADLELTGTGFPAGANVGDTLHVRVTITNNGPNEASGVKVLAALPAGLSHVGHMPDRGGYVPGTGVWSVGSLSNGVSASLTLDVRITAGAAGTTVTFNSSITSQTEVDPDTTNHLFSSSVTIRKVDLQLSKGVDMSTAEEGDTVIFTVKLVNAGPDTATGIRVTDLVPAGFTLIGMTADDGSYNGTTGRWTVSALAGNVLTELKLRARVNAGTSGTTLTNTATITAVEEYDGNSGNDVSSAAVEITGADLQVVKTVDLLTPNEGDTLIYRVTVRNAGPSDATSIQILDRLPSGCSWLWSSPTQGVYNLAGGLWSVGHLAVSAAATLEIGALVNTGTAGSVIVNSALLTGANPADLDTTNNAASASSTVQSVELVVGLLSDQSMPAEESPVRLTLTVTNNGPHPASGVGIRIPLPAALELDAAGPSQGFHAPATGDWTVGPLAAGSTATLILDTRVAVGSGGAPVTVTAWLESLDQADLVSANDTSSVFLTIPPHVTVSAVPLAPTALLPGSAPIEIFDIRLVNRSIGGVTLDTLRLANRTTGPGSQAERDGDWSPIVMTGVPGATSFTSGLAEFNGLGLSLPGGDTLTLVVSGGVSLAARDGDTLIVGVATPGGLGFTGSVTIALTPPTSSGGFPVDGMAAAQVAIVTHGDMTADVGTTDVLAMEFVVPPNGYDPDVAEQIRLINLGTARPVLDLSGLHLWSDGGDARFTPGTGDDVALGTASFDGTAWTAAVSVNTPGAGSRIFVAADISPVAEPGRTIRMMLPASPAAGLEMQSTNDGPRDLGVASPRRITITGDPTAGIYITTRDSLGGVIPPGGPDLTCFEFSIENRTAAAETLVTVRLENTTDGSGTPDQLDGEWSPLTLFQDGQSLGTGSLNGGFLQFNGLSIPVPAGQTRTLTVTGHAALGARDGDRLDIQMPEPPTSILRSGTPVIGSWPLAPTSSFRVNGMVSAQVGLEPVPEDSVTAGDGPWLALAITVPPDGYLADRLHTLRLSNRGTAVPDLDIQRMDIWRAGPNGRFDGGSGDDVWLGEATWDGSYWVLDGLDEPISIDGLPLFITVNIDDGARPGHTIRLGLPDNLDEALTVASDNDGPIDGPVANPSSLTIAGNPLHVIIVTADVQISEPIRPGGSPVDVLTLRLRNQTAYAETLTSVRVQNLTQGPGSTLQLDGEWSSLQAMPEGSGSPLSTVSFLNGTALLSGFFMPVPPGRETVLVIRGGATLAARDGDRFDLGVTGPADIGFTRNPALSVAWPLHPAGSYPVDGMVRDQLTVHPIDAGSFLTGDRRQLALDVTLPPNGYTTDILQRINVANLGTARPVFDIERMELWTDDGTGAFDADRDLRLGVFQHTGDRWEVTGLSTAIPLGGRRLFVTIDIASLAEEGRTIRLSLPSLPDLAIGMASGNDGPLDRAGDNPATRLLTTTDRISLAAEPGDSGPVRPGQRGALLMNLRAVNTYEMVRTVTTLTFRNASSGNGTPQQLDGGLERLSLHRDGNGDGLFQGSPIDPLIGTSYFSGGQAAFRGIGWQLTPWVKSHLFLVGDVSASLARDGDVYGVRIQETFDLDFEEPVVTVGQWPLDSPIRHVVDGMVASQIATFPTLHSVTGPGSDAVPVFDFVVPANGYELDVLSTFRLVNRGTAGPSDVTDVRVWRDGGDGLFTGIAGDDRDLGSMVYLNGGWTSAMLDEPVPANGARLFVTVRPSATPGDSVTVLFEIPRNAIDMQSGNDGPLDAPVRSPRSLLISSAPILASIETEPRTSTIGRTVIVRMDVRNQGDDPLEDVQPAPPEFEGDGRLTLLGGPNPAMINLAPGAAATFEWSCLASEAGDVQIVGEASGRDGSGNDRRSVRVSSNRHTVFVAADELDMFAVEAQPFGVGVGQAGVVPLSLTFRNPGGSQGSDIRVTRLRIRVEDENGSGIVPSELFAGVSVNEGNRFYLVKSAGTIETSGAIMELALATPVLVTRLEPVTINLQLDLDSRSTVADFRVVILDASWVGAEDAASGAPVEISLQNRSFPVRSGLARIVSEATRIRVSAPAAAPRHVGPGRASVSVLTLQMTSDGIANITSDGRLVALSVVLVTPAGGLIAEPETMIDHIQVRSSFATLASKVLVPGDGGVLSLPLAPVLSLPSNVPVTLELFADIAGDAPPAEFEVRLSGTSALDVRDANTRNQVPVTFETATIAGPRVRIESPARHIQASGMPLLPGQVTVGQRDLPVFSATFTHPGAPGTARLRLEGFRVQCRSEALELLPPENYLTRIRIFRQGVEIAASSSFPSAREPFLVTIPELEIDPGASVPLDFLVDINAAAPATYMQLLVSDIEIIAVDANSGQPVDVAGNPTGPVLFSGLTRLQPPAREIVTALESRMPAALVADGRAIDAAILRLTNTAPAGSGPIRLSTLTLLTSDHDGNPLPGGVVSTLGVTARGGPLSTGVVTLGRDSLATRIAFDETILIEPGNTLELAVTVAFDEVPGFNGFRIGCNREGVGVVQPTGALLEVLVRAEEGKAFPLWTESGHFSPARLKESYSNFPNPFAAGREASTFVFFLPEAAEVTLEIWTLHGDRVVTLLSRSVRPAGLYQEDIWNGWNGQGHVVTNGVYLAELSVVYVGGRVERLTRKVAVVR